MHFGYFRWGMNPLRREAMLEQMNQEVMHRLHLKPASRARVFDMGCGLGTSLRSFARSLPHSELNGITLVPWQLEHGRRLKPIQPRDHTHHLSLGNYERTTQPPQSFDAIFAIESSCYARGREQISLPPGSAPPPCAPGGRIVIADGFLGPGKLHGPHENCSTGGSASAGSSTNLGRLTKSPAEFKRLGFKDLTVERIQSRVTASVLQLPLGHAQISVDAHPVR